MTKKLLLIILSVFLSLSLFGCSDEEGEEVISDESGVSKVVSEAPIGYENAYLSVDMFRFSIKIDGVAYKLPSLQSAFKKNGWEITGGETTVKSRFTEDAVLSKNGVHFDIVVVNPTINDLPFEECPIGRLSFDFESGFDAPESDTASTENTPFEIYLADNFLLNGATKTEIIEKYGEPTSSENYGDYSVITYGSKKTTGNYATYFFRFNKKGKIESFNMSNYYIPEY
jgi:hypothetical protein